MTVTAGHLYVMGDNRNDSTDSRYFGLVDVRQVIGKVHVIILPGDNEDSPRDWSRLGSVYR